MLLGVLVEKFDHLSGCRVGEASNPGPEGGKDEKAEDEEGEEGTALAALALGAGGTDAEERISSSIRTLALTAVRDGEAEVVEDQAGEQEAVTAVAEADAAENGGGGVASGAAATAPVEAEATENVGSSVASGTGATAPAETDAAGSAADPEGVAGQEQQGGQNVGYGNGLGAGPSFGIARNESMAVGALKHNREEHARILAAEKAEGEKQASVERWRERVMARNRAETPSSEDDDDSDAGSERAEGPERDARAGQGRRGMGRGRSGEEDRLGKGTGGWGGGDSDGESAGGRIMRGRGRGRAETRPAWATRGAAELGGSDDAIRDGREDSAGKGGLAWEWLHKHVPLADARARALPVRGKRYEDWKVVQVTHDESCMYQCFAAEIDCVQEWLFAKHMIRCALKWPSEAICEELRGVSCECCGFGGCRAGWRGKETVPECEKWMRVHAQAMIEESATGIGMRGCEVDLVVLTHVFSATVEIAGVTGMGVTEGRSRLGRVGQHSEESTHHVRLQFEHDSHYSLLHEHEGAEAQEVSLEAALVAFHATRSDAHSTAHNASTRPIVNALTDYGRTLMQHDHRELMSSFAREQSAPQRQDWPTAAPTPEQSAACTGGLDSETEVGKGGGGKSGRKREREGDSEGEAEEGEEGKQSGERRVHFGQPKGPAGERATAREGQGKQRDAAREAVRTERQERSGSRYGVVGKAGRVVASAAKTKSTRASGRCG
jgi:hypothetical protein